MLIALFTLLVSLFFGSNESPFIIPKAEKHILQVIENKDRKKEAKAIIKTFNQDWKALEKSNKKRSKQILALNKDFSTKPDQFKMVFDTAKQERIEYAQKLIDTRLKLQSLLSESEWTELKNKTSTFLSESNKKVSKKEAKDRVKQDKQLTLIRHKLLEAISEENKQKANNYFDSFENALAEHVYANRGYAEKLFSLGENKNASKEEIELVVMEMEKFRSSVGLSFIELRFKLISLSDDSNWSKVSKPLSKMIN